MRIATKYLCLTNRVRIATKYLCLTNQPTCEASHQPTCILPALSVSGFCAHHEARDGRRPALSEAMDFVVVLRIYQMLNWEEGGMVLLSMLDVPRSMSSDCVVSSRLFTDGRGHPHISAGECMSSQGIRHGIARQLAIRNAFQPKPFSGSLDLLIDDNNVAVNDWIFHLVLLI